MGLHCHKQARSQEMSVDRYIPRYFRGCLLRDLARQDFAGCMLCITWAPVRCHREASWPDTWATLEGERPAGWTHVIGLGHALA